MLLVVQSHINLSFEMENPEAISRHSETERSLYASPHLPASNVSSKMLITVVALYAVHAVCAVCVVSAVWLMLTVIKKKKITLVQSSRDTLGYSGILCVSSLRVAVLQNTVLAGTTDSLKTCRWSIDGRGGMDNLHLYLCVCVFVCVFLLDKFFPHNKIFASF